MSIDEIELRRILGDTDAIDILSVLLSESLKKI